MPQRYKSAADLAGNLETGLRKPPYTPPEPSTGNFYHSLDPGYFNVGAVPQSWAGTMTTGRNMLNELHQAVSGRVTVVADASAPGGRYFQIYTAPTDTGVSGSGSWARTQFNTYPMGTSDPWFVGAGDTQWTGAWVYFPSNWPSSTTWAIMGPSWHHSGPTGQANSNMESSTQSGTLQIRNRWYGGSTVNSNGRSYRVDNGGVTRGVWHHLAVGVHWSTTSSGWVEHWWDGVRVTDPSYGACPWYGPTLYTGMNAYEKVGLYFSPTGAYASGLTIRYARLLRGYTRESVS